jgi:hypothetical protein
LQASLVLSTTTSLSLVQKNGSHLRSREERCVLPVQCWGSETNCIQVGPEITPCHPAAIVALQHPQLSVNPLSLRKITAILGVPKSTCVNIYKLHQQKTFPSGWNGCVRVDALRQSRQRHPGGRLLRARRQYHASRCISPSDRSFAVSSVMEVHSGSSAGDLVPYSQSSGS